METQTFWLSFFDPDLPKGEQFLGVAIVDVTTDDAEAVRAELGRIRAMNGLRPPEAEAIWIAAAIRKAHAMACNPGGEVAAIRIDDAPQFADMDANCPRDRVLSEAQLRTLGHLE